MEHKTPPYMHDFYNVQTFYRYREVKTNSYMNILNSTIDAVNENRAAPLPAYVIFIPDWDLCKTIAHFNFGISNIIHMVSKFLFSNIAGIFCHRKEQLLSKKPEGIGNSKHPKIIWVSMINRPRTDNSTKNKLLSQREKYNYITDELAAEMGFYIMNIEACHHNCYFDHQGDLNSLGKEAFWKELDYIFKKHDNDDDEFNLTPLAALKRGHQHQHTHQCDNHRCLPAPPRHRQHFTKHRY